MTIYYKRGFKYQLAQTYVHQLGFVIPNNITTSFIDAAPDGLMVIREGYAWDGPSGPAIDTKNFMRSSLVHDALYQLMRDGFLDKRFRDKADLELKKICLADGMCKIRAWWVYKAVRGFAGCCITHKKEVEAAP